MKKINEIFYSIQGEGYYTGVPAVFIRFSGCNLECDFCDTVHNPGKLMSEQEIVDMVQSFPAKHIVLTGGEPSMQLDDNILSLLKSKGFYLQIETNGTLTSGFDAVTRWCDWITCSPKKNCIRKQMDELKVVFQNQDMSIYDEYSCKHKMLQPCSMQNTKEVIEFIKRHPEWRLSLQTHKYLHIR
ncbi:7-carboxy-7-deazaguanine synthase QueE [Coprobacter sp.]